MVAMPSPPSGGMPSLKRSRGLYYLADPDTPLPRMASTFVRKFLRRRGAGRWLMVGDSRTLAWRFCNVAWQIGETASWRDNLIDPRREMLPLVWLAVKRSLIVAEQIGALQQLSHDPSLQHQAARASRDLSDELESLSIIEAQLGHLLIVAREIDAMSEHEQTKGQLQEEIVIRQHEAFSRLFTRNPATIHKASDSERAAEVATGLAAEADYTADSLVREIESFEV